MIDYNKLADLLTMEVDSHRARHGCTRMDGGTMEGGRKQEHQ
jgi:hypothetical protein